MDTVKGWFSNYSFLWQNDFDRGYITAILLVLTIVILMLITRTILAFIFRTRRSKELTVRVGDGDVVVSLEAISDAVRAVIGQYPALQLHEVKLFHCGKKHYFLELVSDFDAAGTMDFPREIAAVKESVFKALYSVFGIRNIGKITIRLEKLTNPPLLLLSPASDAAKEQPKCD